MVLLKRASYIYINRLEELLGIALSSDNRAYSHLPKINNRTCKKDVVSILKSK
jgi:hypothetical protein